MGLRSSGFWIGSIGKVHANFATLVGRILELLQRRLHQCSGRRIEQCYSRLYSSRLRLPCLRTFPLARARRIWQPVNSHPTNLMRTKVNKEDECKLFVAYPPLKKEK